MMAECHGQRISGVQVSRFLHKAHEMLQHFHDLLFGGVTIARDGLFDFFGRVFDHRHALLDGGGDGHALCTTQFKHALHVFSEEGCFDGAGCWLMQFDEGADLFMDFLKTFVGVEPGGQFEYAHADETERGAVHFDQSIPHDLCAGVYAQDDFWGFLQGEE